MSKKVRPAIVAQPPMSRKAKLLAMLVGLIPIVIVLYAVYDVELKGRFAPPFFYVIGDVSGVSDVDVTFSDLELHPAYDTPRFQALVQSYRQDGAVVLPVEAADRYFVPAHYGLIGLEVVDGQFRPFTIVKGSPYYQD